MKAVIVGCGNIGKRYLEGALRSDILKVVVAVDPMISELQGSYDDIASSVGIDLRRHRDLSGGIVRDADIIVVSTNSRERVDIVRYLASGSIEVPIILEKTLAPDMEGLMVIDRLKGRLSNAWVNHWLGLTHLKNIIRGLPEGSEVEVEGNGWGICCNASHFLDLIWRYSDDRMTFDKELSQIDGIIESKRRGYQEVLGELFFRSERKGVGLRLVDRKDKGIDEGSLRIRIRLGGVPGSSYEMVDNKLIERTSGKEYRFEYLSEYSTRLIKALLEGRKPDIPSLEQSIEVHRTLFEGLAQKGGLNGPSAIT